MDDHTVVGRALEVVGAVLDADSHPVGLAALTRATGIPKPTVRRMADGLVARRVLAREPAGYRIGPAARDFSERVVAADERRCRALPALTDLFGRTGGMAWLLEGCADGSFRVVATVQGREVAETRPMQWPRSLRDPSLMATALGPAALASQPELAELAVRRPPVPLTACSPRTAAWARTELSRVSNEGYALEHEQVRLGWSCLAVPVQGTSQVLGVVTRVHGYRRPQVLGAIRATVPYLADRAAET